MPREYLGQRLLCKISYGVSAMIILTAQNAGAIGDNVDMLKRARTRLLTATERIAFMSQCFRDRDTAGPIHDLKASHVKTCISVTFPYALVVRVMDVISGAEHGDCRCFCQPATAEVLDIAQYKIKVIRSVLLCVAFSVEC